MNRSEGVPLRTHPIRTVVVGVAAVLLLAPAVQAVVSPTKVLSGPGDQFWPFANDTWLTYSFNDGGRNAAMAMKRSIGNAFRMNEARTNGVAGGIDPGTDVAIYQQYGRTSKIYLYDMGARTRKLAPVNSTAWEWDPRISATFIAFFRNRTTSGVDYVDVYLYRRDTKVLTRIAALKRSLFTVNGNFILHLGSVGDRYLTWTGCVKPGGNCDAWVYDSVDKSRKLIRGNGANKNEYAPVADETNGFIYYTRSGNGCAADVGIWRVAIDDIQGPAVKVADLPDGYDTGYVASLALNPSTGAANYFFSRGACANWNEDIYVAKGLDTA